MIVIGKTYCIKAGVTKHMIHKITGFLRNKDIAYMREGVVVMSAAEIEGSQWGTAFYCLPRTILFPTPAPKLGKNRYEEEMVIFESEFKALFEPMYIKKEVEESVDDAMKFLMNINMDKLPQLFPEIVCENCGRSVYVGKCCDNPKIIERV